MSTPSRSDVLPGVAAVVALVLCCGAPLLIAAIVTAVAGAGLVAQGAVLIGAVVLGLAAALGLRYALRRAVTGAAGRPCAECAAGPAARHQDHRHAVPPPA